MAAIPETELERCLDQLYGSVTAPEKLHAAIRTIRLTFGAAGATHLHVNAQRELVGFVDDGHDPDSQGLYVEHYAALDPKRPLFELRPGEWLRDDRLLDPRHATEPEFVSDFAPHIGMRWFLGCKLYEGAEGVASFSLERGHDAPPFDEQTFEQLRHLQPHLKRVFRMMLELAPAMPAIASAAAAMDMLQMPVCVVDKSCRIIYCNPAAQELFSRSGVIETASGRLGFSRPDADEMLQRAVTLAASRPAQASAFSPQPHASAVTRLQVRAVPLSPHLPIAQHGHGSLVLLFLVSGSAPPLPEELRQLFGLTRAEADLVALLAQGVHLEHCAALRGVSMTTVRSQVSRIYAKTGAGSQAQLLSMALALPALRS